jgi:hypothetical protein
VFTSNITVQRVEVHSTGPVACFFGYSGLARDSVCTDTAADGVAVDDSWGGGGTLTTGTVTLRNITAIATGTTSYGIRADGSDFANLDINARNVIASGTKADFRATRTANSSDSDITITNSNYDLTEGAGNGVTITVAGTNTNQTAQPVFADTVSYHQRLGSPTIEQGGSDAGVGTSDLDGSPRKIGLAVDIGADEFDPTPPDVAFDHTPKRKTHKHKSFFTFHSSESSTFICNVDKRPARPCVSPFKVRFKKRGKHTVTVVATDAVGNVDATPASYTWKIKKKKKRRHGHHSA